MKKFIFLFLISFILTTSSLFAQSNEEKASTVSSTPSTEVVTAESEEKEDVENEDDNSEINENEIKQGYFKHFEIVAQFETNLYLSPESLKNKSNVSNIVYPISLGILWPKNFWIGFQPTISLVPMNFLWFENMALPAEIENRTTTTLMTFVNLPAVFTFKLPHSKMHLSAGLGLCLRYGFLSIGVKKTDPGYNGNTAAQDVELINKWFWENGHWLYLTAGTSWLYPITDKIQIGPVIDVKLPMGILIDQHNVQGMMISLGFKLCL